MAKGTGNLDERGFQLAQRAIDHPLFIPIQISARLGADHCELVDEHFGQREIHLLVSALRVRDLPEEQRGILRLHHDEFDENLRHFARFGLGLDFGHKIRRLCGGNRDGK